MFSERARVGPRSNLIRGIYSLIWEKIPGAHNSSPSLSSNRKDYIEIMSGFESIMLWPFVPAAAVAQLAFVFCLDYDDSEPKGNKSVGTTNKNQKPVLKELKIDPPPPSPPSPDSVASSLETMDTAEMSFSHSWSEESLCSMYQSDFSPAGAIMIDRTPSSFTFSIY